MSTVTVVFVNGNVATFEAQEFDTDLQADPSRVGKHVYKDAAGQDSAVYLQPSEVAGVFVTPSTDEIGTKMAPRQN